MADLRKWDIEIFLSALLTSRRTRRIVRNEAFQSANEEEGMSDKKHRVEFKAHKTVREEVPVRFRTRDGERVAFEAKKKVKEPVKVKFMARGK
jgi:hypothetical protein